MIESLSDVLSIGVTIFFIIWGIVILCQVSAKKHENVMKKREARYYHLYDESLDDSDDEEDEKGPYYEE